MARTARKRDVKESKATLKGGSVIAPPTESDYKVIEGGKVDELEPDSEDKVELERKRVYKHRNLGVSDGAAALFFAIFGQIVKDGNGNVIDGYVRFPNSATDAIDAYFGEPLTEENSEMAEICINSDGEEYFRTMDTDEILALNRNKHLITGMEEKPLEQLAFF